MRSPLYHLIFRTFPVCLFAMALASCAEVDSRDLRSSGFHADISVYAEGNGQSTVWVRLSTGSSIDADEINLSPGDRMQATAAGITRTLTPDSGVYLTSFPMDTGGTSYQISLLRTGTDVDAPNSNVVLPPAFDIVAPASGAVFNAGELINTAWGPASGGVASVQYRGHCISAVSGSQIYFGREFTVPDTGTHSVPVNSVLNVFGDQSEFSANVGCSVEISIERKVTGVLDPNFGEGGSITARQTRTLSVVVNP